MKNLIVAMLGMVVFNCAGYAQDWKAAVDQLPKYDFGQSRAFINPLIDAIRDAGGDAAKQKPIAEALAGVISGQATIEAKRVALRAVGPIASAAEIPAIAALANDPQLGETALWALDRITDPAAGKALVDALAAAPADRKIAFVTGLGWRKEPTAAAPLAKLLTDKDSALALAAAAALARIDASVAGAALHDARTKAEGAQRAALSNLALRAAEQALANKDIAGAVKLYEELSADGEAGYIRAAALNGLVKAEPDKALARVVKALTNADTQLARVAGGFVRTLPGDAATKAFAGLLGEAKPETQAILIEALADRGDAAAHDAVVEVATKGDEAVKLAALKALGKIGNESDVAGLVGLVATASGDAKRLAQTSLETLPGAGVNAALLKLASEGEAAQRSAALASLTARHARETHADLMKLLDAEGNPVKPDVYAALEVLGAESDLGALIERLASGKDKDNAVALTKTLVAMSNRIPAEDKRAAAVEDAFAKAKTPESRGALLQVLAGIPTAPSLEAINAATQDADAVVRLAAVKALAAWPDATATDALLAIAKAPKADEDRAAALAGYVRLVRENKELPVAEALADYKTALSLAKAAPEKKQVIAGLGALPSKEALEVLEGLKGDADLATDASSGVITVARLISGAYPAYAKEKLTPFAADGTPEALKKPAQAALGLLGGFEDYITAWQVSGPYMAAGESARDLFEKSFAPETAPKDAHWNVAPLAYNNPESPDLKAWAVDLGADIGGQERVAYLHTNLTSKAAQELVLELGTNDGCKVWLNGKLIHSVKEGRAFLPGQDKLPVSLNAGKNDLLIAVYQQGGPWAASARLTTKDGKPAADVAASAE